MSKSKRVICPGCNHSNSLSANFCEKCGYNLQSKSKPATVKSGRNDWIILIVVFVLGLAVVMYYNSKLLKMAGGGPAAGQKQTRENTENPRADSGIRMPQIDENILEAKTDLVNREPENYNARIDLANYLFDNLRFEEALGYYQSALKLNSNNADIWVDAGVSLFNLDRLDEAAAHFKTALTKQPGHTKAMYNLGIVYLNQQKNDELFAIWNELVTIAPNSPEARQAMQFLDQLVKKE